MNIKVLGDGGTGSFSSVARGIIFATKRGANVINMSLATPTRSKLLQDAIVFASKKGVLLAAAAGNDGVSQPYFPAAYIQVISVAATNQNDLRAAFSNFGSKTVDVAAPGVLIFSTMPTHLKALFDTFQGFQDGTSQATAFVSGLAALIKATFPRLNNVQIRKAIELGTVRVPGVRTLYRFGRINALKSLKIARKLARCKKK